MAYKFQRGEAILSGALLQEGDIEIESGFNFKMHEETILDTSRNLTVADMSGSGKLEVGGTVQLDGVADEVAVASDKLYFLDSDGFMKADAIEDVRDNLIFASVSGDATVAAGGALTIAAGAVENDMLAGSIENAKLVNDSVTVTAGAALTGGGEVDLGASINLDVAVDDSSIEVSGDALQVKALGITNDMLAGSIASSKIAELNAFDTADLAEGSNLYFTEARARASVSVTDAGGDGSLTYDSGSGVITFTGPSAAEVRAHFSGGEMIDLHGDGEIAINASEFSGSWDAVLATKTTDDLDEGSSHLYFEDSRARAAVSVTDAGGDGSLTYDSGSGVFTYTGPSAAEVRAHFSGGEMIDLHGDGEIAINAADFSGSWDAVLATKSTDDLAEGSNLYYTEARWDAKMAAADTGDLAEGSNLYFTDARARAAVSVTDAGGDGSLAYDSSTGVITYTGPSADEVRAHLSVADSNSIDMAFAAGQFSADVLVDDHSIEIDATDGLRVKALGIENSMLSGGIASSKIAELNAFDTADLAEGSNLYFTEARARASLSIVDAGGDGSFAYDDSTGVFTYTGPSAAEVRAHLSVADTNSIDMSVADGQFSADLLLSGSSLEVTADGLRLAAAAAGAGLAWTDGVLSVEGSVVTHQASNGALAEGYNYMSDLDGAGSSLSMTLPATPDVGDIVHVKAGDLLNDAVVNIARAGSQLIDGEQSIVLESPFAAVSLVYVASNDWRIV